MTGSSPTLIVKFDPFRGIFPRSRAAGAWVHVDGAFGLWSRPSGAFRYLTESVGGGGQLKRRRAQGDSTSPYDCANLGDLIPEKVKLASGMFNLMRNLGGAIGIAACGTVLNDRANLHFLRLAEHLTAANPAIVALYGQVTSQDLAQTGGARPIPKRRH